MRWDEVRRDEMRWEEMRWGEMRWSVECEVQVWSVKSAVWSVRKVFAWPCIAPGSRTGHVLGQQHCNSFAQSTRARAWLAHGACWKSLLRRQQLPAEVRPWRHRNHGEKNWPQPCVLALALRNYLQCGATTIVPDTNGSYSATYCLTNPTTILFHPVSWSLSHVTSCFGVRTAHSNNKWSLVLWWLEKRLQPLRALTLHMFLHVRA